MPCTLLRGGGGSQAIVNLCCSGGNSVKPVYTCSIYICTVSFYFFIASGSVLLKYMDMIYVPCMYGKSLTAVGGNVYTLSHEVDPLLLLPKKGFSIHLKGCMVNI